MTNAATSTELPRALLPWSALLTLFPRELALSLGALVQRVSLALGPLRTASLSQGGEPDGYDGIARRGLYERLLTSEWLLADELPDEFVRRAAASEHAFLRLSTRAPGGSRRSLALFDAGPLQLGTPRLAHLAALIALARRAAAAGVRFDWGTLQRPEQGLIEGVNESSVLKLLAGRSVERPSLAHVQAWAPLGRFAELSAQDDLWLVGGAELSALPRAPAASLLLVRDVLLPKVRRLAVAVQRGAAAGPEVILELPDEPTCVRLLRDPFGVAVARNPLSRLPAPALGQPRFSVDGRRLYFRMTNGALGILPLPNSPRAPAAHLRIFRPPAGHVPIAVGQHADRAMVLTLLREKRELLLYVLSHRGHMTREPPRTFELDTTYELGFVDDSLGLCLCGDGDPRLQVVDAMGVLWSSSNEPRSVLLPRLWSWAGITAARQRVYISGACAADDWLQKILSIQTARNQTICTVRCTCDEPEIHMGYGGVLAHPLLQVMAVRMAPRLWRLLYRHPDERYMQQGKDGDVLPPGHMDLHAPAGTQVVGVMGPAKRSRAAGEYTPEPLEPELVMLGEGRRELLLVGRRRSRVVYRSVEPIAHVAVSSASPQLACLTEAGELTVLQAQDGQLLLRYLPGESA